MTLKLQLAKLGANISLQFQMIHLLFTLLIYALNSIHFEFSDHDPHSQIEPSYLYIGKI